MLHLSAAELKKTGQKSYDGHHQMEVTDTQGNKFLSSKLNASGSVCSGCKFDKKCNMQDNGRYKEICSHFLHVRRRDQVN